MKKAQWLFWSKLIVGFLIVIVASYQINKRESILDALQQANWTYILLAVLLLVPNVTLAYIKWLYLVRLAYPVATHRQVGGSLFLGFALGMITPGRLGELGRGFYFPSQERATLTGLNVLDKLANQIIFLTLGTMALVAILMTISGELAWLTIPSAAGCLAIWFLIFFRQFTAKALRWLTAKIAPKIWIRQVIEAYHLLKFGHSMVLVFWSLIWTFVIILQYHLLVRAFTPASVISSLQAVPATLYIKTLLPFTFGDLGIREGIAVYFYGLFDISSAAVFNASLCIFFINFLLPALIGLYFIVYLRPDNATPDNSSTPGKTST